jgi:hypothetical protein
MSTDVMFALLIMRNLEVRRCVSAEWHKENTSHRHQSSWPDYWQHVTLTPVWILNDRCFTCVRNLVSYPKGITRMVTILQIISDVSWTASVPVISYQKKNATQTTVAPRQRQENNIKRNVMWRNGLNLPASEQGVLLWLILVYTVIKFFTQSKEENLLKWANFCFSINTLHHCTISWKGEAVDFFF